MKISVIHNTYKDNPFIRESLISNLKALEEANVDYQYIVFNDNGDECIEQYVEDLPVTYHYSDYNFGKKMCSGGWVGAIPLLEGDLVHSTGQDDVHTSFFYDNVCRRFVDTNCDLVFANGFKTHENLTLIPEQLLPHQKQTFDNPRMVLRHLLGMTDNKSTRCWNFIAGPGVVYKKKLHDEIGEPDLDNFFGAGDQEYWYRVLFNEKHIEYIEIPCWLYRISKYSAGSEIIDGKQNNAEIRPQYIKKIQSTYERLLNEIEK